MLKLAISQIPHIFSRKMQVLDKKMEIICQKENIILFLKFGTFFFHEKLVGSCCI